MSGRVYAAGELVPGTIYKVVRTIDEGGMGRVYEVEDTTLGKRYALKTLSAALQENAEALVRMAVESRTLVLVSHPNVVNVFTAGTTSDGCFYYVMELLRGATLRHILDQKQRLDLRYGLPIALAVAHALERAHAKGVVHRDVKPGNIFVSMQSNHRSVVKLLDFGVAALVDNLRFLLKDAGMMLGTPRYAAPEQQRGAKATPAMDIWSLGAVLFEMVAGVTPFERGSGPVPEQIAIVKDNVPAPPLTTIVPDAPERLVRLVAWMLEKDPGRRIPSISTVISELSAIPI